MFCVMKSFLIFILLSATLFVSAKEKLITVRSVSTDGVYKELKIAKVLRKNANTLCVEIPKEKIPSDILRLEVLADFAEAFEGEQGYWIGGRGFLGEFNQKNGYQIIPSSRMYMPLFGMKTKKKTFFAVISGMRFDFDIKVESINGHYKMYPRWLIKNMGRIPYEDIKITYYTLHGKDANYSGMARAYRKMRLENGDIKPIKERIKYSPYLEKLANSVAIRMMFAKKNSEAKDYTLEDEPKVNVIMSFSKGAEIMKSAKNAGIDDLAICVAGWQTGGYDGRCPTSFPVCKEAGGEAELKKMIKVGQDLGYIVDGHSNYTDAFSCSPQFNNGEIVCMTKEGTRRYLGAWSGGRAYNLCLKHAWETFLPEDIKKISELGFKGAHYIDVFSAVYPYDCFDKNHSANRVEQAEVQKKVLAYVRKHMKGVASECGFDHIAGHLDYINYVSSYMRDFGKRPNPMTTRFVPFWELVYHGIILSNPDKITQNTLSVKQNLKLVEFGGRPIFYSMNSSNISDIKKAFEQFKKLRYLQFEYMENHQEIARDVFKTDYSDGSYTVVNYRDVDFNYKDKNIPANSFILENGRLKN